MDSDHINRWLTLGANLGVLVGIILLVIELNQNRDLMRAQTRNDLSVGIITLLTQTANNSTLSDIMNRGDAGEELTATEYRQYLFNNLAFYRYYENVHYQYRQGLYDEGEFTRQKKAWKNYAAGAKTAVKIWCERRSHFSPEFAAEFNALLTNNQC